MDDALKPGEQPAIRGHKGGGRPRRSGTGTASVVADAVAGALTPGDDTPKRGRPSKAALGSAALRDQLRTMYVAAGSMLAVAGLAARNVKLRNVGLALQAEAENCAAALVKWSESSDMVAKALQAMAIGGGFSMVAAAHAPIVMAAMRDAGPDDTEADAPGLADLGGLLGGLLSSTGGLFGMAATDTVVPAPDGFTPA